MLLPTDQETNRRRAPRHQLALACKARAASRPAFYPGKTQNVSLDGALVWLRGPRRFRPGEHIELAIEGVGGVKRRAVAKADDMIPGEVVRAAGTSDGQQLVAVRFAASLADVLGAGIAAPPARAA